jgi:hypothetical protein
VRSIAHAGQRKNASVGLTLLLVPEGRGVKNVGSTGNHDQYRHGDQCGCDRLHGSLLQKRAGQHHVDRSRLERISAPANSRLALEITTRVFRSSIGYYLVRNYAEVLAHARHLQLEARIRSWWLGPYQPGRRRAMSARISTISLKRPSGACCVSPARSRASKAWRLSPSAAGDVLDLE